MANRDDNLLNKVSNKVSYFVEYWQRFLCDVHLSVDDYIIVLNNPDYEVNYYTLHYLCIVKKERRINKFILVSDNKAMEEFAYKYATADFDFYYVDTDKLEGLFRIPSIHCLYDQILVNSPWLVEDVNAFALLGVSGIEKKDIVAISILRLKHIPTEEEIAGSGATTAFESNKSKFYNWNEMKAWVPCDRWKYNTENEFVESKLNELLEKKLLQKDNKIYVFGMTVIANLCKKILEGYEFAGIVDNSAGTQTFYMDNQVYLPEEVLLPFCPQNRILITTFHYKVMCEQLKEMGYELGKQVFIVNYRLNWWENQENKITDEILREIEQGYEVYESLKDKYPTEEFLICPLPGSGDIYLIGLYLKDYIEREKIAKYVFVVLNVGLKKVAELFGIHVDVLPKEQMDALYYWMRLSEPVQRNYRIIDQNIYQRQTNFLQGIKGLDYNSMLQHVAFSAPERKHIPQMSWESASDIFEENHILPKEIVLLSPYAKTVPNISVNFWAALAKHLRERGYIVFTNVSSKDEQAVAGTIPIFIPYIKALDFVDNISAFVGLRSGLADIISSTKSKMVLLYSGNLHATDDMICFFGLSNMGLKNEGIIEIDYNREINVGKSEMELVEEICDYIMF